MNVTGESFDYGPYRFLPVYDPAFTAAYFDHAGLYAYERQPTSVHWNLQRFADTLVELSSVDALSRALDGFLEQFLLAWRRSATAPLRLRAARRPTRRGLPVLDAAFLVESRVGYDRFFFDWKTAVRRARAGRPRVPRLVKYAGRCSYRCAPRWTPTVRVAPGGSRRPTSSARRRAPPAIDEIESLWDAIADARRRAGAVRAKVADIRRWARRRALAALAPGLTGGVARPNALSAGVRPACAASGHDQRAGRHRTCSARARPPSPVDSVRDLIERKCRSHRRPACARRRTQCAGIER